MKDSFIIESFWQGKSNCACVAFIKACLVKFGWSGGLKTRRTPKYILVELRDQRVLAFTPREITDANKGSGMRFRRYRDKRKQEACRRIKQTARLYFAVLVRNMQTHGYNGKQYPGKKAVEALTEEGMETAQFHALMGMDRKPAKRISLRRLSTLTLKQGILVYNKKHITVASAGMYEDFGKAIPIDGQIPDLLGKKATAWFELK